MMGATEAHVRMPKPSCAFFAFENPMPIESTNGTVTGPVVTPDRERQRLTHTHTRNGTATGLEVT